MPLTYNSMVVRQGSDELADRLFRALGDATRREIVALTLVREHTVTDLAERFPMSFAAVQKHVAVLERAGLVVKQRRGREQRVRGNPDAVTQARVLLERLTSLWQERVDRIDALLATPPEQDADHGRSGAAVPAVPQHEGSR